MNAKETEGYQLAKGAMIAIGHVFLVVLAMTLLFLLVRNIFGWHMDDSDTSAWKRSGLTIHRDAKTGVEYLSDGHGGMVKRYD